MIVALLEAVVAMIMACNYYRAKEARVSLDDAMGAKEAEEFKELFTVLYSPYVVASVILGYAVAITNWSLPMMSAVGFVVLGSIWLKFLAPRILAFWRLYRGKPLLVLDVGCSLVAGVVMYHAMLLLAYHTVSNFSILAVGAAVLLVMYTERGLRVARWILGIYLRGQLPR